MIFRPQSPDEVNILLPTVLEHFSKIKKLMLEAGKLEPLVNSVKNGSSAEAQGQLQEQSPAFSAEEVRLDQIEEDLGHEFTAIHQYGGIVKNVFPGRIDFLTKHHKKPAYLCWHEGQDQISHWQPIGDSFYSQQPIENHKAFTVHYIN